MCKSNSKKYSLDTKLICCNCNKASSAREWDKQTIKEMCLCRSDRRKFKSLANRNNLRNTRVFYVCPVCHEPINTLQIKIAE